MKLQGGTKKQHETERNGMYNGKRVSENDAGKEENISHGNGKNRESR